MGLKFLGTGENSRILTLDVERFVSPSKFKCYDLSRSESLHLDNTNLESKRAAYFKAKQAPKSEQSSTKQELPKTVESLPNKKRIRR